MTLEIRITPKANFQVLGIIEPGTNKWISFLSIPAHFNLSLRLHKKYFEIISYLQANLLYLKNGLPIRK